MLKFYKPIRLEDKLNLHEVKLTGKVLWYVGIETDGAAIMVPESHGAVSKIKKKNVVMLVLSFFPTCFK